MYKPKKRNAGGKRRVHCLRWEACFQIAAAMNIEDSAKEHWATKLLFAHASDRELVVCRMVVCPVTMLELRRRICRKNLHHHVVFVPVPGRVVPTALVLSVLLTSYRRKQTHVVVEMRAYCAATKNPYRVYSRIADVNARKTYKDNAS